MGIVENRIKDLGYELPAPVVPVANYVPAVLASTAGLVYTSGHVARKSDGAFIVGKLGADISVEDGYDAAKLCALDLIGTLKATIGELDRVTRIVKLLCMVNSTPDFGKHPLVANGASDFIVEVFGEKGSHSRSAIGVVDLPGGACIEIELIAEVTG